MSITIGQRLRKAREHEGLTLGEASEATRIRVNYLQALEGDDYSLLPSAVQGRGFLRNYAEFLGLNLDEIVAELQKDPPVVTEVSGPLPSVDMIPEAPAPPEEPDSTPFWTRYLPRKLQAESAPVVSPEPQEQPAVEEVTPVVEEKPVKRRGRKKKEVEVQEPALPPAIQEAEPETQTSQIEAEQIEVPNEAQAEQPKPNRFARFRSFLKGRADSSRPPSAKKTSEAKESKIKAPEPAQSTETAEQIFISIGEELRQQRELISLTFDEVERLTKVRAQFLKELETGDFDKLPSPVQTRGMLANYATFLDLDVDALLLHYAEALQARHRQKYPDRLRSKNLMDVAPSMPPLRSFLAGDFLFGLGMIAVLIGLAIWGVGRVMNSQGPQQSSLPTAPSISDVLAGSPQPTAVQEVTFIPLAGTQFSAITEEVTTTVEPLDVNVQVIMTVAERAFVRVSVDGEEVFNGRVLPGDTFTYEAENQISVLTGNGAALLIRYNGRDLGLMGDFGQVVSQVYSASGLVTATPTLSPTPTITPKISMTPTFTEAVTPTVVGTPTP